MSIQQIVFYLVLAIFVFLIGAEMWKMFLKSKKELRELQGGNQQWQDMMMKKNPYQKWKKESKES